jgi:hypothetical protein
MVTEQPGLAAHRVLRMSGSLDASPFAAAGWGPLSAIAAEANSLRHPDGILPVPHVIPGPAFFPGGRGLVDNDGSLDNSLPVGGIMVLGNNYGTVADHRTYTAARGEVEGSPTWIGLRKLLNGNGIPLDRCFFTNAHIGLLDRLSGMGPHPGDRDRNFLESCRQFLRAQILLQLPRVILALWRFVPGFLSGMAPTLADWKRTKTIARLDASGPLRRTDFGGHEAAVAVLTHTSMRGSNVHRRTYLDDAGLPAEEALLGRPRPW